MVCIVIWVALVGHDRIEPALCGGLPAAHVPHRAGFRSKGFRNVRVFAGY
jgi:hypothetical protein